MSLILVLAGAGCGSLDASQPIALVPDADWTPGYRDALVRAAECWNLGFGTQLVVGNERRYPQEVGFSTSDFVCTYAAARTEPTLPVHVYVCPLSYWTGSELPGLVFMTLLHELGHVVNIRAHAESPLAVMGYPEDLYTRPSRFTEEDQRLFAEANPELPAGCAPRLTIADTIYGYRCSCP